MIFVELDHALYAMRWNMSISDDNKCLRCIFKCDNRLVELVKKAVFKFAMVVVLILRDLCVFSRIPMLLVEDCCILNRLVPFQYGGRCRMLNSIL